MALRAKVRGQWRVVSKAMARRFRARGIEVVDEAARVTPAEETIGLPGVTTPDLAAELAKRELEARSRIDESSFVEAATKLREEAGEEAAAAPAEPDPVKVIGDLIEEKLADAGASVEPRTLSLDWPGSSHVRAASLDEQTGIVTVTFKNGQTARYSAFTADLMAQWKAAPSPGSWFHHNVRSKPTHHKLIAEPLSAE